mmetsp:Transcript_26243/g.48946  ORF Transcript_26243/g.48946 Transcript_26243/m.48946 type:complete len:91 (-) Transcript_26243:1618-1890(-)
MSTAQETVGIELESKGRGKKFEHLLSITQIQKRGFDLVARWETQCAVGYTAVKTFGTKGRAGGGTRIGAHKSELDAMVGMTLSQRMIQMN